MNQSIQFPDREEWDEVRKAVCFPALSNGMQLQCAVSATELYRRFGDGPALDLFREYRWDIEEEMESVIAADHDDQDGWFWLSSER